MWARRIQSCAVDELLARQQGAQYGDSSMLVHMRDLELAWCCLRAVIARCGSSVLVALLVPCGDTGWQRGPPMAPFIRT